MNVSIRHPFARVLLPAALSCALATTARAAENVKPDISKLPAPAQRAGVTYEKDIRPILETHCFKCHGPDKHKGGLRLDSLEAVLKGGEDGKVVTPGDSATSMLVINVGRVGKKDDYMPPPDKGEPLTPDQIALIRAWIDQGAK